MITKWLRPKTLDPASLTRREGPVNEAVYEKNRKVLEAFIQVYCRKKHGAAQGELCPECGDLYQYACKRVQYCPYDPKPKCKQCPTHCYKPEYREKIKEVMRFSGMYFVKRGRIDWLIYYFFTPSI